MIDSLIGFHSIKSIALDGPIWPQYVPVFIFLVSALDLIHFGYCFDHRIMTLVNVYIEPSPSVLCLVALLPANLTSIVIALLNVIFFAVIRFIIEYVWLFLRLLLRPFTVASIARRIFALLRWFRIQNIKIICVDFIIFTLARATICVIFVGWRSLTGSAAQLISLLDNKCLTLIGSVIILILGHIKNFNSLIFAL